MLRSSFLKLTSVGISHEVLVDSGSASNLVSMQQELIWPWRPGVRDMGQFTSVVSMDSVSVSVQFIVVKKGQCLLEYSTAVDLVPGPVTENCNVTRGHFCREPESQVS